jgi:hypothetical protein
VKLDHSSKVKINRTRAHCEFLSAYSLLRCVAYPAQVWLIVVLTSTGTRGQNLATEA